MKIRIFFRYLFGRLFVPFAICVSACALIWIMVDLYGNIDDFLEHKTSPLTILRFYFLQLPTMAVQVLPAAMLFSTLWTLLALNRRSELVAFQSGGMAPIWLFSPFFVFALIWIAFLMWDLNWPAPRAAVTSDRLLEQVKGQVAKYNVFVNLPYVDNANNRIWFFQNLDLNQDTGKGVEILQRDANNRDVVKYFGNVAKWTGSFWRLTGVLVIDYNIDGNLKDQKSFEELDLPDINTPPQIVGLVKTDPDELTMRQLSDFIAGSTASHEFLAKYRTEWWYRVIYPFSIIVLMFYGLFQGTINDRRGALGGVMIAIVAFGVFEAFNKIFLAAGWANRLPPFIAAIATELILGGIGLYVLSLKNGWHLQVRDLIARWRTEWSDTPEEQVRPVE
jgi:lipopolysaccharide export system permease protein